MSFIISGVFISFIAFGVTLMLFSILNTRKIMAYHMQEMRPLVEEKIEKMSQTVDGAVGTY